MKTLSLSPTGTVVVDDDDYEDLGRFVWFLSSTGYAVRNLVPRGTGSEFMHRRVMKAVKGEIIDHVSGAKTDNRKVNLRKCTAAQNAANAGLRKNNTSGFRGVSKGRKGRWRAHIKVSGKFIYLGEFATAKLAGDAYSRAAALHFGKFARLVNA